MSSQQEVSNKMDDEQSLAGRQAGITQEERSSGLSEQVHDDVLLEPDQWDTVHRDQLQARGRRGRGAL